MPENDLNLLRNAAIGAGKIAMRFYQKNPISWDKGDGQGPVSEADLEIDKMLFDFLSIARPNYSFLSEDEAMLSFLSGEFFSVAAIHKNGSLSLIHI